MTTMLNNTAAETALEIRKQYGNKMEPLCILKSMPNVLVHSFADVACRTGEDREAILSAFRESQDAVSIYNPDRHTYFVVYNQRMPFETVRYALARELGHIVLGHDGTRPEDVRQQEAVIFADALLSFQDSRPEAG